MNRSIPTHSGQHLAWVRRALCASVLAITAGLVLPTDAEASVQWIRFPYPANDDPNMTPTKNCRAVYGWGGARASERQPPGVAALNVYYQLHQPWADAAYVSGDGDYVDGIWVGNPPAGVSRAKAGSCWAIVPGFLIPLQGDRDYSGEVIDHEWYPEFLIPRPPSPPIDDLPSPPPPPQFTKEELDGFTITFDGPNGRKRHWVRSFRNVIELKDGTLTGKLQTGWVLYEDTKVLPK